MNKPYSQASENNKLPIFDIIKDYFKQSKMILEIGSGTGQHAVYFAEKLAQLHWQTSDQKEYIEGINQWVNGYARYNLGRPFVLDVTQSIWPVKQCDGVYSANTSHIMSWGMVDKMFSGVANILTQEGYFCLYGPFNFDGQYTSSSNQAFDRMLRERNPESGLRDFEDLEKLADEKGLIFVARHQLPANNNILVWQPKK
ncbi:MAG: cyclopropane fatty-acyl-phospholipid synthase-like methyltransferase [Enterobacterales bacterium]|jgi:cyclopropane fatty-acyl-phospholipid synthase-like methyltransferase